MRIHISQPQGPSLLEQRSQLARDVTGHDPIQPAEPPPSHEHHRQLGEDVVVDLEDGRVGPEPLQQALGHVAHAAAPPPHHHHRALRHHSPHLVPPRDLPEESGRVNVDRLLHSDQ